MPKFEILIRKTISANQWVEITANTAEAAGKKAMKKAETLEHHDWEFDLQQKGRLEIQDEFELSQPKKGNHA